MSDSTIGVSWERQSEASLWSGSGGGRVWSVTSVTSGVNNGFSGRRLVAAAATFPTFAPLVSSRTSDSSGPNRRAGLAAALAFAAVFAFAYPIAFAFSIFAFSLVWRAAATAW